MLSAGARAITDVEKQNEASLLHTHSHGVVRHLVKCRHRNTSLLLTDPDKIIAY